MNPELAKQLKEAGYPQKAGNVVYFLKSKRAQNPQTGEWYTRKAQWKHFHHLNPQNLNNEWYSCPTLSELVEACGDDFEMLRIAKYSDDDIKIKGWEAEMTEEAFGRLGLPCVRDCCGHEWGDTPEEAVARLYLALNKK
jgi:hypothetical protein